MSNAPTYGSLTGTVHAAVGCVTNAAGSTVCTGTSSGFLAGLGVLLFVYLAILILSIIAAVKVVTKAGYSGWWVLITLVPLVGAVFVFIFAFSTWPITREVQMLRSQLAGSRGYRGYGGMPTGGPETSGPFPQGPAPTRPAPPTSEGSAEEQKALPTFGQFIAGGQMPSGNPSDRSGADAPLQSGLPPAGWYPAPGGAPDQLRYWDGSAWTDEFRST
jgi:hypothetical protein